MGKVFEDTSLSAWNPKIVRPEWDALMGRLESGEAHGVIVMDLTRFSRKVMEGERLVALADRGTLVWSLSGEYDLTTADGRSSFRNAMVRAAEESDKISERTSRGKARKASRGRSNASWRAFGQPGNYLRPTDWESGDPECPVPDELVNAERDILRQVTRRLLDGQPLNGEVRWLAGIGSLTVTGKAWTAQGLKQTLRRPSVAGLLEHRGEIIGTLPGEPVLTRQDWDRLMALFDSRRLGRPISGTYLLSGLAVCGRCGARLYGRPRVGRAPYPDGEVAREYWCHKTAHGIGCGGLTIDQRWADSVVAEHVMDRLADPRQAARLAARLARSKVERSKIVGELSRLEDDADALGLKVADWGLARVDKSMVPLTARMATLRTRLSELDGPETVGAARSDTAEDWESADTAGRRAMIARAFPRLTIMPATSRGIGARTLDRFNWDGAALPE